MKFIWAPLPGGESGEHRLRSCLSRHRACFSAFVIRRWPIGCPGVPPTLTISAYGSLAFSIHFSFGSVMFFFASAARASSFSRCFDAIQP
jgi:hypothetical protein